MKGIITIVVILAVYAGALLWKGSVVDEKKARHFPSVYELHKENGTPVYTEEVVRGKFEQLITVTGRFDGTTFKASVTPQDRSKVYVGQSAIIEVGDEKTRFTGTVSHVAARPSLLTGLNEVEIRFPRHRKLTGHYTVDLPFNSKANVIVVSRDSVNLRESSPFVYVVRDNQLLKQEVKIAGSNSMYYQLASGVKEGDMIVSSDSRNLSDGLKVKIVNELRNNL